MPTAGDLADRWREAMGDWSDDDPEILAWLHKENQPVVADVDGQLRMYHSGLLDPWPIDDEQFPGVLDDLGEPSVINLSDVDGRFERYMFEWEASDA